MPKNRTDPKFAGFWRPKPPNSLHLQTQIYKIRTLVNPLSPVMAGRLDKPDTIYRLKVGELIHATS